MELFLHLLLDAKAEMLFYDVLMFVFSLGLLPTSPQAR